MVRSLVLFFVSAFSVLAQSTFGEIHGSVRDSLSAEIEGGVISATKTLRPSYELLRFRAQSVINSTVPPENFRSGNLSSLTAALRGPFNGNQPFAGNILPTSRISSVSTGLLRALYPTPLRSGDSIAAPNFTRQDPIGNTNEQFDIRDDHNINNNQRTFGRFSCKTIEQVKPTSLPTTIGYRTGSQDPTGWSNRTSSMKFRMGNISATNFGRITSTKASKTPDRVTYKSA